MSAQSSAAVGAQAAVGHAFISYAREDGEFASALRTALRDRKHAVWIDSERIPLSAEWWEEIRKAIDSADACLFVISPHLVTSEVCRQELEHAVRRRKRLVPILRREVTEGTVPAELAKLNWVFLREEDAFDARVDGLVKALDTDLEWVRDHTWLTLRAVDWEKAERDPSSALRGRDLAGFENWLQRAPDKEPAPTALQSELVIESRRATTRRQRIVWSSVLLGVTVAVVLALVGYFESREKARQAQRAEAQRLLHRAEVSRDLLPDDTTAENPLEHSLRSGVTALALLHELGERSPEADEAVRSSMALLPRLVSETALDAKRIDAWAVDQSGRYLVLAQRDEIHTWDLVEGRVLASCPAPTGAMQSIKAVAVAPGGERIAWSTYDASSNVNATTIRVAGIPGCQPERELHRPAQGSGARLELSSRLLAELNGGALTLSSLTTGADSATGLAASAIVRAFALSPEGERIAVAYRERGSSEQRVRVASADGTESLNEWTVAERIGRLRWVSDHSVLAFGATSVDIYDVITGERTARRAAPGELLSANANGTFLAEASGRAVRVRHLATGEEYARIVEGSASLAFAFLPDVLQMATVNLPAHALRHWTMEGARAVAELGKPAGMRGIEFSSDSASFYTRAGSTAMAWRLPMPSDPPGPPTENGSAPPSTASSYVIEHNEQPIGSNEKGWLELRRDGERPTVLRIDLDTGVGILAAALSDDLRLLAIITGRSTRGGWESRMELWEVPSSKRRAATDLGLLGDRYADRVQFAPDARLIVTATRSGWKLWRSQDLGFVAELYHPHPERIAFQPGGRLAASVANRRVTVFDVGNALEVARIAHPEAVVDVAVSPDGRWLATLADEGVARLWVIQPRDLIRQACARVSAPCGR